VIPLHPLNAYSSATTELGRYNEVSPAAFWNAFFWIVTSPLIESVVTPELLNASSAIVRPLPLITIFERFVQLPNARYQIVPSISLTFNDAIFDL